MEDDILELGLVLLPVVEGGHVLHLLHIVVGAHLEDGELAVGQYVRLHGGGGGGGGGGCVLGGGGGGGDPPVRADHDDVLLLELVNPLGGGEDIVVGGRSRAVHSQGQAVAYTDKGSCQWDTLLVKSSRCDTLIHEVKHKYLYSSLLYIEKRNTQIVYNTYNKLYKQLFIVYNIML